MSRQTVLLLFGGQSSEHDVSIMSARNVYAALDSDKYEVKLTYIDKRGKWWLLDSWKENLSEHGGVQLVAALGMGCFMTLPGNTIIPIDVALPIMHGPNGHEDGALQGLFALMNIPVVGSGIGASAVSWDKRYTKQVLEVNGILVAPYRVHQYGDETPVYSDISAQLESDILFVKPTTSGSSVGVSKVQSEAEFLPAIEEALKYSDVILIEKAITGRELEVAVLGNPPSHQESGVGEIIAGEEFYNYQDKYSSNSTAQVVPHADIPSELSDEIRRIAHRAYEIIGCRGLARIDFLVSDNDEVIINEFNTLPGFTSISQYPKLWGEQDIKYPELIDRIIALALE